MDLMQSSGKIQLIDADYLPYAYGNYLEEDIPRIVTFWFEKIFKRLNSRNAIIFLKQIPQDNFRYNIAVNRPYKGTRNRELPISYNCIINYITTYYQGVTVKFAETDDAIAMAAKMLRDKGIDYVIVSDDKDLNMIHGWHYKHTKDKLVYARDEVVIESSVKVVEDIPVYSEVLEAYGELKLWLQMILGDTSDNIEGIPNYGINKIQDLGFAPGITVLIAKVLVWNLYKMAYPFNYKERFIENYRLLKLIDNSQHHNISLCPIQY